MGSTWIFQCALLQWGAWKIIEKHALPGLPSATGFGTLCSTPVTTASKARLVSVGIRASLRPLSRGCSQASPSPLSSPWSVLPPRWNARWGTAWTCGILSPRLRTIRSIRRANWQAAEAAPSRRAKEEYPPHPQSSTGRPRSGWFALHPCNGKCRYAPSDVSLNSASLNPIL